MNPIKLLYHYHRTKQLRFTSRDELEAHQQKQLYKFIKHTLKDSPYFAKWAGRSLSELPYMDKSVMMAHFDEMNTAGLMLRDVLDCAKKAEQSRDFSPTLQGYSVGLSSGTSGKRGVFLVSPSEQAAWAGTILAKLLPRGLLHKERIAFFLRASNNLYNAVRTPTISFQFFDLFDDFENTKERLHHYNPTILVAPAQVLRALATDDRLYRLAPSIAISVAEVLDPQTKALLTQRFGKVGEVYQATEGFLGCTCSHGNLHLNEEYIYIEKQWLDEHRFLPIITDFSRVSQPIVRYRLDDVLTADSSPCACGCASQVIARIEGRHGDTLLLASHDGKVIPVFADVCERIFAQVLPLTSDYQLTQLNDTTLELMVDDTTDVLGVCQQALLAHFDALGIKTDSLNWQTRTQKIERSFTEKRRRIRRLSVGSSG